MQDKHINMSSMLDIVESDPHSIVQRELAVVASVQIDEKDLKKHYAKNPSAKVRDLVELSKLDQTIKSGGFGNATSKNLTININGLGLSEKMKMLKDITNEVNELGSKLGYERKKVEEPQTLLNVKNDKE